LSKTLLVSARPEVLKKWQDAIEGVAIPHAEALARIFSEAHANKYQFRAIYMDFRDPDRSLIRALFQTAGFNRENVAGTELHMDVDPGSFADQQRQFFSGLGMTCHLIGDSEEKP